MTWYKVHYHDWEQLSFTSREECATFSICSRFTILTIFATSGAMSSIPGYNFNTAYKQYTDEDKYAIRWLGQVIFCDFTITGFDHKL